MNKRIITLCYRKVIDINSLKPWDRIVFEDSYMEFKLQSQNYSVGTPFTSYAELIRNFPNAQQLPAKITPAVTGYIKQLQGIMPDILNNIGRRFLQFDNSVFELINSDIKDQSKHQVAVNFYSKPLIWHDTISNFLLVSQEDQESVSGTEADNHTVFTHLFQLQSYLTIYSLQNKI